MASKSSPPCADAVIGLDKDLAVFVIEHPIRNPRSPRWTSERTLLSHHLSQIIPREEQCPSPSQSSEKHKIDIAQREAKERTAAPVNEERARSADRPRELERDEERQRQEREQQREEQRLNPASKPEAEHKIDVARFRSDPDYRREVRERTTAQLQEERARSADRPRELERGDRQR